MTCEGHRHTVKVTRSEGRNNMSQEPHDQGKWVGIGIRIVLGSGIGAAFGAGVGTATNNVGAWVGIGVVFGVGVALAIGAGLSAQKQKNE